MGSSPAPFPDIGKKAKGKSCSRLWTPCFSVAAPFINHLLICRSSKQGLHLRPEVYSDNAECHWNGMLDWLNQILQKSQFAYMTLLNRICTAATCFVN